MSAERKLMGTTDGGGDVTYIEDVFSTYLYTGNGSTQTINNGIDLSTKGGMVWAKARSSAFGNAVFDTVRGSSSGNARRLITNSTAAATTTNEDWLSFNSNGFTANADPGGGIITANGTTYASWTFRKQAKFFDVVTYTGTGSARTIAHNLGSTPGCIIVKCTSTASDWAVYHRSTGANQYLYLNRTDDASFYDASSYWNNTAPTSSVFSVGTSALTNSNGATYVAYLFAHDAGGFGASGTDNVISCGSYTGNGSTTGPSVTLGYEPQYVMVKASSTTGNWVVLDVMRGMSQTNSRELFPNLSSAEYAINPGIIPTATGFSLGTTNADLNAYGVTYIYMAIRRGPMRTPTSGTSVFSPITVNSVAGTKSTTGFPVDMQIMGIRAGTGNKGLTSDRLRGVSTTSTDGGTQLITSSIAAETTANAATLFWDNTGFQMPINYSSSSDIFWNFGRAPGFFDVVCYTGDGVSNRQVPHNLGVMPELVIAKKRSTTSDWQVSYTTDKINYSVMLLNLAVAVVQGPSPITANTALSATSFNASTAFSTNFNNSGQTFVAYLFASCPGVSKVGSYTGNGTSQTINCGFTSGARFVLIKRTDSTGDWYTYDTARGMVSGTDPYLLMNSTAAENTSTNYVFTSSTGFSIQAAAPAGINANGGTFIYLAIA